MPGWLFVMLFGPLTAVGWVLLVRGLIRGELRVRQYGMVRRQERPLGFWSYAAFLLVLFAAFTMILIFVGMSSWQGWM